MMLEEVRVGLLGLGTVGQGVVTIIQRHQEELQNKLGCSVKLKKILVQNKEKERSVDIDK